MAEVYYLPFRLCKERFLGFRLHIACSIFPVSLFVFFFSCAHPEEKTNGVNVLTPD